MMNMYEQAEALETLAGISPARDGRGRPIEQYGLCSKCKYLCYRKTRYGVHEMWCDHAYATGYLPRLQPSSYDQIAECSNYYPRGQMSMVEMLKIATFITVTKPIGFKTPQVTFTPPERISSCQPCQSEDM